jgi:hypothetical protein
LRASWRPAAAACAALAIGSAGCGDDDDVATDIAPWGTEITVMVDDTPKEQSIDYTEQMVESYDLNEEMEQCMLDHVEETPDSEFPRWSGSPDESFLQGVAAGAGFGKECRPASGDALADDPSEETKSFVRFVLSRAAEIEAKRMGGGPSESGCARFTVEEMSDEELVAIFEGSSAGRQRLIRIVRRCVRLG